MTTPFTARVIRIIASIPRGRVSTYGIIAAHANYPQGARQVARILHSSSAKYDLPWHRVINREGRISLRPGAGYERQRSLLEEEGVIFDDSGRVDFTKFLWLPGMQWPHSST